jgi:transcriptional regulator with XRE-family HTH domain
MGTERTLTTVGQRIKQLRDQRKWSQLKLAHEAGIALNTISRLERGEVADPSLSTLEALADAFGVTTAELVAKPDPEPNGEPAGKAAS